MLKPRNTLVTVAEINDVDKRTTSGIVIPSATGREYKLCDVLAVGPGMLCHKDEVSPCCDLAPGQVVLVKLVAQRMVGPTQAVLEPIGVKFTTEDGRPITVVDQSQIVAIVRDAGESGLKLA